MRVGSWRGGATALTLMAGVVGSAGDAQAETVTLSSPGGLELTGDFLGYDGEFYRLRTAEGRVTVAAVGMLCEGTGCPGVTAEQLQIAAGDASLRRLIGGLLAAYADNRGWQVLETHGRTGLLGLSMGEDLDSPDLVVSFGDESPRAWRVVRDPVARPPVGWQDTAIAFDALVPAVSVENPVTGLTLLGVRAALAGEFPDWRGLGGDETPVTVHWPDAADTALAERYGLRPGSRALRHEDSGEAADAVASDPGGLGLLVASEIAGAVPLVVTGPCGRGTLAVPAAVRTGDFPFSELLLLRHPSARQAPLARAFLTWIQSGAAKRTVREAGFVDLGVGVIAPGRDGRQEARPVELASPGAEGGSDAAADLEGARRLDIAVRFQDGSSLPDRAARFQIARLVQAIRDGQFAGAGIVFAGFSDANGAAATNLDLSRRRAEAIRSAVLAGAGPAAEKVVMEARGFGEAMPVACNGSDWGESLNRRVEVWLLPPG